MAVDTTREEQAMRRLTDSLVATYTPAHTPEHVEAVIDGAHARFADSPVREFVPVLVERIARGTLETGEPAAEPEEVTERISLGTSAIDADTHSAPEPDPSDEPTRVLVPGGSGARSESVGDAGDGSPESGAAEAGESESTAASRPGADGAETARFDQVASGPVAAGAVVAAAGNGVARPGAAEGSTTVDPAAESARPGEPAESAEDPAGTDSRAEGSETGAPGAPGQTNAGEVESGTASALSSEPENRGSTRRDTTRPGPKHGVVGANPLTKRSLALIGGALAVVAVVIAVLVLRQPGAEPAAGPAAEPVITLRGLVGSEKMAFFADPRVAEALAAHGLAVDATPAGSREMSGTALDGYGFAFPASAPAAERILRERGLTAKHTPFSSPMAIATFRPIADLLTAAGVLRPGPAPTFDMARYLELAGRNTEWAHLPANTTYPVRKNILVSTTDPRTSNSAAMYLAIAAFVANDHANVQGPEAEQRVLPLMARLFTGQGFAENSSAGPFEQYLSGGMGPSPLVMIYEAQFIEAAADGRITPDMVLTYPSPTILSTHTLVPLDEAGDRLGRLLSTDPELRRLAAEHGFRTGDTAEFARVAAAQGVAAPADLIDVIDPPTLETQDRLLDGVTQTLN
ncbi:three-helix bundle dimerization domain-containing protein [Nocardia puris]|uniref:three-helix bundle dimerization domain-containing protein n=1 Tax=Nocardia puris TaxID=208602 RepID=UPI002B4B67F1|nr:hypothetical protein [Nocardia puris]